MAQCMLTTLDNPYDPFKQFDDWYRWDVEKGYNSCAYLARIAAYSDDLSDEDRIQVIEDAIDEICRMNLTGNYKKVWDDGLQ